MTAPEPDLTAIRVHDEEIDSAIEAVSHPDAPYSPEALALAAAVRQLRAERDEARYNVTRERLTLSISADLRNLASAITRGLTEGVDPPDADLLSEAADKLDALIGGLAKAETERDEARAELERLRIGGHTDAQGNLVGCAEINDAFATMRRLVLDVGAERDEYKAESERLGDFANAKVQQLKEIRNNRLISAIFGTHPGAPRPFALYRREDATGVSGTGVVAVGAEFPDGMVVLRWASEFPTSVVFHERGIESVEAIHGHGGNTQVVWLSDELEPLAEAEQENERLTAERDEARDEVASQDVTIVEMNKALTRVEAERDALREELAKARHDLLVMDAARSPFAHSAALVEHLALAIRARERTPRQIADEEIERGYHNALNGYREVARAILRDFDKALAAVVPAPAASSVDGPIAILQLAGHGYTGHGHRCCKQAPTDQQPSPAANCGGPKRCEPCSDDVDDIHARSEAPAAIWCRRCNTLIGPEKLDDHNREHHVPAAAEPAERALSADVAAACPWNCQPPCQACQDGRTPAERLQDRIAEADVAAPADRAHVYLSTFCLHGTHDECGAAQHDRGDLSAPHCKGCPAPCICPRHTDPQAPCWGGDQRRTHRSFCGLDAGHLGWCGPALAIPCALPMRHVGDHSCRRCAERAHELAGATS